LSRLAFPLATSSAPDEPLLGDAASAVREATSVLQTWKLDPVTLAIRARAERQLGQPAAGQDQAAGLSGWRGGAAQLRASAQRA
jgi:hypothetical protein